jgi:hypothetical protein
VQGADGAQFGHLNLARYAAFYLDQFNEQGWPPLAQTCITIGEPVSERIYRIATVPTAESKIGGPLA